MLQCCYKLPRRKQKCLISPQIGFTCHPEASVSPAAARLLLQVELRLLDGSVDVGVHGHVGFLLLIAEEERVLDDVGVKAFPDEVAFALLEGPRDLQGFLWGRMASSETGGGTDDVTGMA